MLQLSDADGGGGIDSQKNKILIAQRSASGAHPLKWEFPGGKVEAGETAEQGLARELREELGIEATVGPEFARYEYAYPEKAAILLVFFDVRSYAGSAKNLGAFAKLVWERAGELARYDFLEGDLALVELLGKVHVDQV